MRSLATVAATTFLLLAGAPAEAQQSNGQFGLGIGLSSSFLGAFETVMTPTVYVPFAVGERLIVEPGLGFVRFSEEFDNFEETFSFLSLRVGLLYVLAEGDSDRIYAGPRIGIIRFAESFETSTFEEDESTTNLTISGVVGGEHFLRPRFSLGGEVGLSLVDLSEDDGIDGSLLTTVAEFRVRWYFP